MTSEGAHFVVVDIAGAPTSDRQVLELESCDILFSRPKVVGPTHLPVPPLAPSFATNSGECLRQAFDNIPIRVLTSTVSSLVSSPIDFKANEGTILEQYSGQWTEV